MVESNEFPNEARALAQQLNISIQTVAQHNDYLCRSVRQQPQQQQDDPDWEFALSFQIMEKEEEDNKPQTRPIDKENNDDSSSSRKNDLGSVGRPSSLQQDYALSIQMLPRPLYSSQTREQNGDENQRQQRPRRRRSASSSSLGKPFFIDFCPPTTHKRNNNKNNNNNKATSTTTSKVAALAQRSSSSTKSDDLLIQAVLRGKHQKKQQRPQTHANDNDVSNKLKRDKNPVVQIQDWTAGFGSDAWLLAYHTAATVAQSNHHPNRHVQVLLFERHALVHAMLHDALRRLKNRAEKLTSPHTNNQQQQEGAYDTWNSNPQMTCHDDQILVHLSRCLQLAPLGDVRLQQQGRTIGLSSSSLPPINAFGNNEDDGSVQHEPRCDIVYLDPMFPPRTKSAAVKKPMQILHRLLHQPQDNSKNDLNISNTTSPEKTRPEQQQDARLEEEQSLLNAAIQIARSKVVVKRPLHAPPLGEEAETDGQPSSSLSLMKPSYAVKGSTNRWDVYVLI